MWWGGRGDGDIDSGKRPVAKGRSTRSRVNSDEWRTFSFYDKDGSGAIDAKELKAALNAMGLKPSMRELVVLMSQASSRDSHCAGSSVVSSG